MTDSSKDRNESVVAARNAATLGTSLGLTTLLAVAVRLLIPRFLGTAAYGDLRLAETFSEILFVFLTFGVDLQLRREAAVDISSVRGYLAGLTAIRLGAAALCISAATALLFATGSPSRFVVLFIVTALSQVFTVLNNSYAALEQASNEVGWLARTNFAVKLLWAAAMVSVLILHAFPLTVAMAALGVEFFRLLWLAGRARTMHSVPPTPEFRRAAVAIVGSLPIFIHLLAHNVYSRLGTAWLGASAGSHEVAYYSAASSIATLSLLGMPLLFSVLVPSIARASTESEVSVKLLVVGALRTSLLFAVPLGLLLVSSASPIVTTMFGAEFSPAANVLRILAPTFALAYISTICAIVLLQQQKTWTTAVISLAGVGVAFLGNVFLVPLAMSRLASGGAAQGSAYATLFTEIVVTGALAFHTRGYWYSREFLKTCVALACGISTVVAAGFFLPSLGPVRPLAFVVLYLCAVLLAGGLNRRDLSFIAQVIRSFQGNNRGRLSPHSSNGSGTRRSRSLQVICFQEALASAEGSNAQPNN